MSLKGATYNHFIAWLGKILEVVMQLLLLIRLIRILIPLTLVEYYMIERVHISLYLIS